MAKKEKEEPVDTIEKLIKESKGLLVRGSDPILQYGRIPFGISQLDALTGGGIPKKRWTLLTGPSNAGKTYLASQVVRSVQKLGGVAAWIDAEMTWDPEWMTKCGVNVDDVLLGQTSIGEDVFAIVKTLMQSKIDLVVVDSLAGLIPTSMQEEDFTYNPMAWQSRMINQAIPRLMNELKHGTAFLCVNQQRSSMGPVSMQPMPGGKGQTYFAHFILEVQRHGWIEENKKRVGFDIEVTCRKSKVGGKPYETVTVPFRLEGGIDVMETIIREAIAKGVIQARGAWYYYKEEKMLGMNGVKEFFKNSVDEFTLLQEAVN